MKELYRHHSNQKPKTPADSPAHPGYPPTPPKGADPYRCESGFRNAADRPESPCGCATDFTGLIPALPTDESELESYAQLYPYPGDIRKD
ncbi:MAG: hypothetical protein LUE86_04910 [Clostridiales bacterium]|nr:hypothetical protein [Clostridiales bacterium]